MTNIGAFGRQAAETYQQVPSEQRTQATVKYTQDFQRQGASMDLFAYANAFDANKDGRFSADEIAAASGLNLQKLSRPSEIETFWDLNGDQKVDLKEAFVGLAHLDFSDGVGDGRITQKGRAFVEEAFFGYPAAERLRQGETYRQQDAFIQSLPDGELRNTFVQQREGLIQKQIQEAHQGYKSMLGITGQALDVERRYRIYHSLPRDNNPVA